MKKLDIRQNCLCPYCNENIGYSWLNANNALDESGPYERYDLVFGFERYYTYTFACPRCGLKFNIEHSKLLE